RVRLASKYSSPAKGAGESCTFEFVELTRTVIQGPMFFAVPSGIGLARVSPGATGLNIARTFATRSPSVLACTRRRLTAHLGFVVGLHGPRHLTKLQPW